MVCDSSGQGHQPELPPLSSMLSRLQSCHFLGTLSGSEQRPQADSTSLSPPGCCAVSPPRQGLLAPLWAGDLGGLGLLQLRTCGDGRDSPRKKPRHVVSSRPAANRGASRRPSVLMVTDSGLWVGKAVAKPSAPALGSYPGCPVLRVAGVPWLFLASHPLLPAGGAISCCTLLVLAPCVCTLHCLPQEKALC